MPPLGVVAGDGLAPVPIPCVAGAAFFTDLGEGGFLDAVAIAEVGLAGVEVVEAGPDGLGGAVIDDAAAIGSLEADAGELGGVKPGDAGFDGADDFGRGLLQCHEEAEDAGAFAAAERGQFVGACLGGGEGDFIVLGTPDGGLAGDGDLALEDSGDAAVEGGGGLALAGGIEEVVVLRVAQQL